MAAGKRLWREHSEPTLFRQDVNTGGYTSSHLPCRRKWKLLRPLAGNRFRKSPGFSFNLITHLPAFIHQRLGTAQRFGLTITIQRVAQVKLSSDTAGNICRPSPTANFIYIAIWTIPMSAENGLPRSDSIDHRRNPAKDVCPSSKLIRRWGRRTRSKIATRPPL